MSDAAEAGAEIRRRLDWRGAVVPVAIIVLLQIMLGGSHPSSGSIASPAEIAAGFWHEAVDGDLVRLTTQTLTAALLGLAIGGVIGLIVGVLFGLSRGFDRLMMVTVESIRPIPSAALIPAALLAFGFGYGMETFLIAPAAIFPVLIFTRAAVAGTEPRLLDFSRMLGLGFWARVFKIVLPAALPRIFVGFRLSAALALVVAVTVEVAVNPQGLGSAIMVAEQSLHPELMYAILIWLGLLGWGMNALLMMLQRRLFGPAGTGRLR
jgi:ABC-type nitrate/sulfonate/bicarbonate transport system permease component